MSFSFCLEKKFNSFFVGLFYEASKKRQLNVEIINSLLEASPQVTSLTLNKIYVPRELFKLAAIKRLQEFIIRGDDKANGDLVVFFTEVANTAWKRIVLRSGMAGISVLGVYLVLRQWTKGSRRLVFFSFQLPVHYSLSELLINLIFE